MKEEYKKWGIYTLFSIAIIFIVSFAIGFFSAKEDSPDDTQNIPVSNIPITEPIVSATTAPTPVTYYLISGEENKIKLYFVDGEAVTELKSEEISTEVFPEDDISMLSEGIRADTVEAALTVWENFIS